MSGSSAVSFLKFSCNPTVSTEDLLLEQSNIPCCSIVPRLSLTFMSPIISIRHLFGLRITDTLNKKVCYNMFNIWNMLGDFK